MNLYPTVTGPRISYRSECYRINSAARNARRWQIIGMLIVGNVILAIAYALQ